MINLLTLIGSDVVLKKKATTKGGEYAGPCPFCGGEDRFLVWPDADKPGWWCRGCHAGGDAIGYVMRRDGLGFREACEKLEIEMPKWNMRTMRRPEPAPLYKEAEVPSDAWQAAAWAFVAWCEKQLWAPAGAEGLAYLHEQRGLDDATIKAFHLGFNPKERHGVPARWGLSDGHAYLFRGVTIPWIVGDEVSAINYRLFTEDHEKRYRNARGGHWSIFGAQVWQRRPMCWVVEGEFDAMLLWQVVGDHANVLTLGSAANKLQSRFLPLLYGVERFWIATDGDDEGDKVAAYWQDISGKARRVKPPAGAKDITDAWRAGVDLADWAAQIEATGEAVVLGETEF